jgi:hypothetical protein
MSPAAFGSGAFGSIVATTEEPVVVDVEVDVVDGLLDADPADADVDDAVLEPLQAAMATSRTSSTRRRVIDRPYEGGRLSPLR